MSIVNTILNKVDLNTTKYSEKLRKMGRDTRKQTKGIGDSFKQLGGAWKAAIAAISAGALTGAISKELMSTEKAVASFIQSTGGIKEARAQFEMLQQAARDTIQPFDALKAASLDLRRNGVEPTAAQLLTYKGVTTELEKNTAALSGYFSELGQENEGVLEYLQGGLTGAMNQLENAWGDFYRALGESGLGDLIRDMVREAASSLDDITAWINENREPIKAFFEDVYSSWQEIKQVTTDAFRDIKAVVDDFWESSGLAAATGTNNMIAALSQLFNFARMGFVQVMRYANLAWEAVKGTATAQWEGISTAITEFSLDAGYKAFDSAMGNMRKNMDTINRVADSTMQDIARDTRKRIQEIEDSALGYGGPASSGSYMTWLNQRGGNEPRAFGTSATAGGGRRGGGGRKAAPRPEQDGWPEYYKSLQNIARQGYSDIEKLRAEHGDRIAELNRQFAASQSATEAEYLAAKKVLDDDYLREYKEKQQEARDYLRELKNDEMLDLDNEYRTKLEKLREFHEQGLIAEQEYQDGLADIRKDYDSKREKKGLSKDQQKEIDGIHDMAGGINTLSEAFSNLTQGMSESSTAYKALFVLQKSFAKPFIPAGLAAYANAVALTTGILGQLKSVTMHDKGGRIPAGGLGIVGEYGPEVIEGPANVTSRRKTADLARSAMSGGSVTVNLYEDASRAGQSDTEEQDGDRIINIFVSNIRRGGQMAKTLENTYQIRRYGA